jgi:glycosyltransferase involved in cell wall biosynthesis
MDLFDAPRDQRPSFSGMFEAKGRRPKLLVMATPLDQQIKGIELFIQAMHRLQARAANLDITTFGGPPVLDLPRMGAISHLGRIDSTAELAKLYGSADLMVTASRMESFGQTAAEALACGTPVVCFDTTGLRDIVRHKQNGYRAECFCPESLAEGIEWCLADPMRYRQLQAQARPSVRDRFDIRAISNSTIAFYSDIR